MTHKTQPTNVVTLHDDMMVHLGQTARQEDPCLLDRRHDTRLASAWARLAVREDAKLDKRWQISQVAREASSHKIMSLRTRLKYERKHKTCNSTIINTMSMATSRVSQHDKIVRTTIARWNARRGTPNLTQRTVTAFNGKAKNKRVRKITSN